MAFNLATATKTETLLDAFLEDISSLDPFEKKWVVTSGKGMRTWMKQAIASKNGISANLCFLSPERAVWSFANLPETENLISGRNPFSKERLAWKIRQVLPEIHQQNPETFKMLTPFITDEDPIKKIQLCWEIATVFDEYLHYRPELLEKWENGQDQLNCPDEVWQAPLWRRINCLMPCPSLYNLIKEESFAQTAPSQLFLFYLSPLSTVHFQAFAAFSSRKTLHAYLLQPTDQYWQQVLSKKEQLTRQSENQSDEDMYLELGPPLLGSLGKSWQKLIFQFENLDSYDPNFHSKIDKSSQTNALVSLQKLLLDMPEPKDLERIKYQSCDSSIQVHSTHGPLREIQILYDFILDQFNQDPDLKPNQILVLCPNLQKYSALVEAIFDNPEEKTKRIPYGLCDRQWRSESRVIDTFYHLLEFAESRATARDFFTLISRPAIREKFDLEAEDLEIIRWWIEQNQIAWGFDLEHKDFLSLPAFEENTWQNGIDRMLLGFLAGKFAIQGFEKLSPFDEIEGEKVEILSKFIEIVDFLNLLHQKCTQKRTPNAWQKILEEFCIKPFFKEDDKSHRDLVEIRKSLSFLTNETEGNDDAEPLAVIRLHLERTLSEKSLFSRHLTYGVTFASLRSARGIPAKVICLLGMNGGEFPVSQTAPSFDLCKTRPKYTDRNQTEEDRLLVMEAILCTRKCFYLSFQGQSNTNNDSIPPSVVVEEIIEQLDDLLDFSLENHIKNAKDAFLTQHPLQAFSKHLFKVFGEEENQNHFFSPDGSRSFSITSCKGAIALAEEQKRGKPFCPEPIVEEKQDHSKIRLLDIAYFWRNPSAFFLEHSLQVSTQEVSSLLPENERLSDCPWQDSSIKRSLIEQFLDEKDLADSYEELRRENLLPTGQIGRALHTSMIAELSTMFRRTYPNFKQRIPKFSMVGFLQGIEIKGEIGPFFEDTYFSFQSSKLKGKNCMEGFILHLFHNLYGPAPGKSKTVVAGIDKSISFAPVSLNRGEEILAQLLEFYFKGLAEPLPFFPNAALAWLEQTIKHETTKKRKNASEPIDCARKEWENNLGGEGNEFATELIYSKDPWELPGTIELNEKVMDFIHELGEFVL